MINEELELLNASSLTTAILAIKDDAQVTVHANDIKQIIWHDDNPTNITEEEILAKQEEVIAAHHIKMQEIATLETKLADDSITFTELKELMRFRG